MAWSHKLMAVMQVVNIPNSMTVLPELLPYSIEMVRHLLMPVSAKPRPACAQLHMPVLLASVPASACSLSMSSLRARHVPACYQKAAVLITSSMLQARRGLTGIMNYTNPGAISHNEILELYKSYIDPEFSWKNFSLEEQAKVIIAPRSNNLLDTGRVRLCA